MFDISQETRSIHWPIEHTGCGDLIVTQGGNECCRHPVPMRHRCDEALTARRASIKARHIGLCSSFINEHKMFRVQTGLARTPFIAGLGDVGAILLGGAQ